MVPSGFTSTAPLVGWSIRLTVAGASCPSLSLSFPSTLIAINSPGVTVALSSLATGAWLAPPVPSIVRLTVAVLEVAPSLSFYGVAKTISAASRTIVGIVNGAIRIYLHCSTGGLVD